MSIVELAGLAPRLRSSQVSRSSSTFRSFWHGRQLSPYELLCMSSFVERGHNFELFTYDDEIEVPRWVIRREAREILPTRQVLTYQVGSGAGSPALHALAFRYRLLHQLGDWWVDLDMLMLRAHPPETPVFLTFDFENLAITAVMKFPQGHPLMADAVLATRDIGKAAQWSEFGSFLINPLAQKHGLEQPPYPEKAAYPICYNEMHLLYDPRQADAVEERCQGAWFMHLYNEHRRGAGVPYDAGPPRGSFLDRGFIRSGLDIRFPYRLSYAEVCRWLNNWVDVNTYKTLYERYKLLYENTLGDGAPDFPEPGRGASTRS